MTLWKCSTHERSPQKPLSFPASFFPFCSSLATILRMVSNDARKSYRHMRLSFDYVQIVFIHNEELHVHVDSADLNTVDGDQAGLGKQACCASSLNEWSNLVLSLHESLPAERKAISNIDCADCCCWKKHLESQVKILQQACHRLSRLAPPFESCQLLRDFLPYEQQQDLLRVTAVYSCIAHWSHVRHIHRANVPPSCTVPSSRIYAMIESSWYFFMMGAVYGKTCEQAMRLHGLQKGQRVCFDIKCVAGIQYHSDSDEDDSD